MNPLDLYVQRFYAQAVPDQTTQMVAQRQLQGAAFDARLDANHPLQQWAKTISDLIAGDTTDVAATPTEVAAKRRWETYVPVALLALGVWLIFSEA